MRTDPDLLKPPPTVVPRLAWGGRATLLAAPEKLGKSTLATQGLVAALTGAEFLGGQAKATTGLWLALDEPLGDLVVRTESFAAGDLPLAIIDYAVDLETLAEVVRELTPSLVVVDCLSAFASGRVERFRDPEQWRQLLGGAVLPLFREVGAASIWIHHSIRDGSRYADSREIGALMDFIVEVEPVTGSPTERKVKGKGRGYPAEWAAYSLVYEQGRYQLAAGAVSLELQVYRAIAATPGLGSVRLRHAVSGRAAEVDEAVKRLIQIGAARDQGGPKGHEYYAVPGAMG